MSRQNVSSGVRFESSIGYSRAVRVGALVFVSGTTATNEAGEIVGPGDAYAQTVQTIRNIERGLNAAGGSLSDVVRTRIFTTDISQWESIGRGHMEFFGNVRPATSMIEVRSLISPEMLVEIEADTVLADGDRGRP